MTRPLALSLRFLGVHPQSSLQHVANQLDELTCFLSVVADRQISNEQKDQLAIQALGNLKKLQAFVENQRQKLQSLSHVSRLVS